MAIRGAYVELQASSSSFTRLEYVTTRRTLAVEAAACRHSLPAFFAIKLPSPTG